jgi:hypothetical protein
MALWLPALVAAHLLAFLFLWRVLCMLYPQRFRLRRSPAANSDKGEPYGMRAACRPRTVHQGCPLPPVLFTMGCGSIFSTIMALCLYGIVCRQACCQGACRPSAGQVP